MRRFHVAIALGAIVVLAAIGGYFAVQPRMGESVERMPTARTIEIKDQKVRVMVAGTANARQKGLSGRDGLQKDEGMLFIFPEDGKYGFWMKDMQFSIDMLWLSSDGRVIYMAENVSPETYPQVFRPDMPARYVIELPAGYAKEYTVSIGDPVTL